MWFTQTLLLQHFIKSHWRHTRAPLMRLPVQLGHLMTSIILLNVNFVMLDFMNQTPPSSSDSGTINNSSMWIHHFTPTLIGGGRGYSRDVTTLRVKTGDSSGTKDGRSDAARCSNPGISSNNLRWFGSWTSPWAAERRPCSSELSWRCLKPIPQSLGEETREEETSGESGIFFFLKRNVKVVVRRWIVSVNITLPSGQ